MKLLKWIIPVAIIAGALVLRFVVVGKVEVPPESPPIPVHTMKPVYGDLVKTLKLNAHVESETMVTVLPLVSGILQELPVVVGQSVRKGQIIARIDAQRYELQVQQVEAAYLSAKSSYERLAQLYNANAATQQSYEQAKGQYEAYSSQYELARIQLDYATVTSPVDGVILIRHATPGAIAAPERPLVTIGDLTDLIVRARVPERYYEVFLAARASMLIDVERSGGGAYQGKIRNISPFVSAETKNFEVVVSLSDAALALRPGMFVSLEFELASWPDVYSLPFEALSGGRLWWAVDGKAVSEEFIPTDATDEAFTVPAAWADRDFIVEGQYFVREGSTLEIVKTGNP
jgi:RND family efflux transporter MFP subunit